METVTAPSQDGCEGHQDHTCKAPTPALPLPGTLRLHGPRAFLYAPPGLLGG